MKMVFITMIFAQLAHAADFDKKVTVTGQCTIRTSPDRGSVTFVVTHLENDAKVAIAKSTSLYEKLRTELKRTRAKDLELSSSEYTVQERKEWEHNKNVSKGFEARLGLRAVTSDIPALGELIAVAAKLGVKETNGLNTFLSEEKLQEEKRNCLAVAAKNARAKAELLATSLGSKAGRALQITEAGAISPGPMPMLESAMNKRASVMDDSGGGAPGIEGQKQTINQTVDVTFALE